MPSADTPYDHNTDRRKASRAQAVLIIGRIASDAADDLCLVRDLSPTGAQIRTGPGLASAEMITLQLGAEQQIRGAVRWMREGTAGVEFEKAINVEAILRPLRIGDKRRSYPRFRRCAKARLTTGTRAYGAELVNISPGGICLRTQSAKGLVPGDALVVSVQGLGPREARIQWLEQDHIGLVCDTPIRFWDLQKWLEGCGSAEQLEHRDRGSARPS